MSARATVRAVVATTTALTLGWVGLAMTRDEPPTSHPAPPRPVSARLLGPASDIAGIAVPSQLAQRGGNSYLDNYLHAYDPSVVTVRLPGGRSVRSWSRLTSVNVNHGVVVDVNLLPLPAAVPFPKAKAELRRLLREMGIEPDEAMRKAMDSWPEVGGDYTYKTRMKLDAGCDLEVDVRSVPGDDDWLHYLAINFAADVDSRPMPANPAPLPAPKPFTGGTGGK